MKQFLKRAAALLLCLALSCSLLPVTGLAASHPFQDVSSSHWADSAVEYVYDNNLMNGTGTRTFAPGGTLTRAMFVTILGRMHGVNTARYPGTSFSDVPSNQWYSPYVAWASDQGIVTGTGNGRFSPNTSVTREQMATMISRYVETEGILLLDAEDAPNGFKDASSVSTWARDGLELMRRTGILTGYADGTFGPKKTATRAEAAMIFMRLCVLLDGENLDEPTIEIEGFVYQDDIIVLDDSEKYSESGNTVTFSKSRELQNLKKDDIVVVGTDSAYKVVSTSVGENSVQVTYTTPELYEFLESIDVEGEAYMDFAQFEPAEGVSVSYNSAEETLQVESFASRAIQGEFDTGIDLTLEGSIPMNTGREIEFKIKEAIPVLAYKFDIDFNPSGIFNANKPALYVNDAYIKLEEEMSVSLGMKKNIDSTQRHVKEFKLGTVPAVGKDGIGILIDLYVAMDVQGSFEVRYTLNGIVGVQIKDNNPSVISELTAGQELSLMGEVKVGPKFSVLAELFNKKLISFSVDAGVRVGGEIIDRPTDLICFDGGINLYLELAAFDKDLISEYLHHKETWVIWDESNSPLKAMVHFENMKRVDACTYGKEVSEKHKVTGTVICADSGKPLSGVKVYLNCIFGAGSEDVGATYTTGADGTFSLEVPNNATTVTGIQFEKDGYKDSSYPLTETDVASYNIGTYQMNPATDPEVLYQEVLNQYRAAKAYGFDVDLINDNNLTYVNTSAEHISWATNVPTIYYSFKDIDKNGTSELVIGVSEEYSADPFILDIFTYNGKYAINPFDGTANSYYFSARNGISILYTGILANEGSGGAARAISNYYMLGENGYRAKLIEGIYTEPTKYDYDDVRFYHKDSSGYTVEITRTTYDQISEKYNTQEMNLNWVKL